MSDLFYTIIRLIGTPCFAVSSRSVVVGMEHLPTCGPFILAATHQSPYDVPLLIRHSPRPLDFVSVTEVFAKPFIGWFYGKMNAFPLERSRADPKTVRIILDRLATGRSVAMFPEGRIRTGNASVLHDGTIRPGLGRLAQLAKVPVVPCVITNSEAYSRITSWLPLRRTRYGIIFGKPLMPTEMPDELEVQLIETLRRLNDVLSIEMSQRFGDTGRWGLRC